ncbi:hypothetical protein NP233_g9859 [Leucocoprinus birnbaumii]|uniref:Uncharacterized protein n=1 Tax=Leucocoprinus birnbaumii TaxID=56174 RepID=A0AAD5VLD6_9AGAR|nr:hypothetical protein NP233_g9859 [Leucocoprinus birnbaumii]
MNLDSSTTSSAGTGFTANSLSSALGPMPGEREREREMEYEREKEREREREGYKMSTLVQPYYYSVEEQKKNAVPKRLYFYTLACSPLEDGPSRPTSPYHSSQHETHPQPYLSLRWQAQHPHIQS